jgi:hypothetical protein
MLEYSVMVNSCIFTPQVKQVVLDFLYNSPLGVLSTLNSKGESESALIAFAETPELEIIFETFKDARKYQNLKESGKVSFVTGWDLNKHITFQYEGIATEIPEVQVGRYKKIFKAKDTPCTDEFIDNPRAALFLVKPKWLRYSDYTEKPAKIYEETF